MLRRVAVLPVFLLLACSGGSLDVPCTCSGDRRLRVRHGQHAREFADNTARGLMTAQVPAYHVVSSACGQVGIIAEVTVQGPACQCRTQGGGTLLIRPDRAALLAVEPRRRLPLGHDGVAGLRSGGRRLLRRDLRRSGGAPRGGRGAHLRHAGPTGRLRRHLLQHRHPRRRRVLRPLARLATRLRLRAVRRADPGRGARAARWRDVRGRQLGRRRNVRGRHFGRRWDARRRHLGRRWRCRGRGRLGRRRRARQLRLLALATWWVSRRPAWRAPPSWERPAPSAGRTRRSASPACRSRCRGR